MIMIFETFLFLLSIIFFINSISGVGKVITLNYQSNFFLDFFYGIIILGFYSTVVHFFFKINFYNSFLIFFIGIILQFFNTKIKILDKRNFIRLIFIIFLIPIYFSQKYHEDFGYYHLPYALSLIQEKIIFGFANANYAYIYNSVWLNISSLFFLGEQNFNFLTFHSFILYLIFIMFLFESIFFEKKNCISKIFSIFILFYFLLKFTRISEYGIDVPAAIFSLLSILYFIKFEESDNYKQKLNYFFFNFSFAIFALLIKLSVLPILLLPFYLFFRNYTKNFFLVLKYNFIFIYIFFAFFFLQQFIYTGCIIFPNKFTCLNVIWFNESFSSYKNNLELINKSYSIAKNIYSPEEYLKNLTWFSFWLKRNFNEILEHITTMILPVLLFIIYNKKIDKKNDLKFSNFKIIYILVFINLFFWLKFSPVYRFAIHLFLLINFLLIINFFYQKDISKKIFIIFVSLMVIFNFSKNLNRINKKSMVFLGIEKINNNFKIDNFNSKINIKIFSPDIKNNEHNGWQGRLCWDIPFICSTKKVELQKKLNYLILMKVLK